MSDMTIFEAKGAVSAELFESLKDVNDNLLSGAPTGNKSRRISISGGKFREFVGGEQVAVSKQDFMNVVIVNAAQISRTYYASEYNPEKVEPPTCWSADTNTPAKEVPEDQRQSARCMDCTQNVKGSGQGQSRACRFAQRIAVVLEDDLDNVYQLQLPATSIFGDVKNGNMPMQAYARHLAEHKAPAIAIVTKMYFDENSPTPKLFFKPVRPLAEEEVNKVIKQKLEITKKEMSLKEAMKQGAQAEFGAKYPPKVWVYSVGDYSKEICMGPHVKNTSELGHFKIKKEESVAAGVRRIKAVLEG